MLHEAVNLVQWLARAGTEGPCEIHFIEPCLAFKIDPDSANHNMIFSVTFKGEASPPWLEGDADRVWRVGYMLAGEIQRESLQTFASVLAALLDVRLNDGVSEQVG